MSRVEQVPAVLARRVAVSCDSSLVQSFRSDPFSFILRCFQVEALNIEQVDVQYIEKRVLVFSHLARA